MASHHAERSRKSSASAAPVLRRRRHEPPLLTDRRRLELERTANDVRESIVQMLLAAGSGHTAGPLGMADIFTVLYFHTLRHDPRHPEWEDRDRLVLSNGHICPVLYAAMAHAGYFPKEELKTLRKLGSRLQGHPHREFLPFLETSSGPLGSGLSQAVGMAIADRMDGEDRGRRIVCVMSDGELEEGQSWEAAMLGGKHALHNLVAVIDRNNIQIDGVTEDVMPLEPLADKWRAWNWHVLEIDGHDIQGIAQAFAAAESIYEKPTVIVAHTIPGKGVEEFERDYRWHGKPPNEEQGRMALRELRTLGGEIPERERIMLNQALRLNANLFDEKVERVAIRKGFGQGLVEAGERNPQVVVLCGDLTESAQALPFKERFPDRFVELGVAEQNMASVASGMAAMGKIPFITSYAMFSPGRNWEQLRTTVCYNNRPVKIAGSHAGVSVGPDGGTHQAIEDIAITRVIPRLMVVSPCDAIEAKKATVAAASTGTPVYIRLAREKTPVMTTEQTPFHIGKAQTVWTSKAPKVGLVATGALLHEALEAARRLEEDDVGVEVMNLSTVKPLDEDALVALAARVGRIVTVEEHQIRGGVGSAVAECLAKRAPVPMEFVGIDDRFGQSGTPDELIELYGMGRDAIVAAVERLLRR